MSANSRPGPLNEPLRAYLEFYRDLGVTEVYRRKSAGLSAAPRPSAAELAEPMPKPAAKTKPVAESVPVLAAKAQPAVEPVSEPTAPASPVAARGSRPSALPPVIPDLPPLAPPDDTLEKIRLDIGEDCRRCRLCEQRSRIVFGVGNERARLVFVGEGPGADEDAQGIPFVGRAGQLLTQMIDNTAAKEGIPIKRADIYICNVVKCRPPENRTPQPDEMEMCGQFLFRQLMAIKPAAICALGSTAAKAILATKDGVTRLRGRWHKWHDIPVMVTYHPSYLLRPYNQEAKREAWEDLKLVLHSVYD